MLLFTCLAAGCGRGAFSFNSNEGVDSDPDTREETGSVALLWVGPDAMPFAAYQSGDAFRIEQISGQFGVPLTLQFSGLDGGTGAGAVIRAVIDGGSSQDAVGGLVLNDLGDGLWTTNTFFPLREQTGSEVAALDGLSVVFTAAMTDGLGTTVETGVDLVALSP